jgi:hypothetical protein
MTTNRPEPATLPGHRAKNVALVVVIVCLVLWASPPTALVAGILFALLIGQCQAADLSLEFFEPPVSQFSILRFSERRNCLPVFLIRA